MACLVQVFADTSAHRCGNKTHCEMLQDLQDQMNHLKKYVAGKLVLGLFIFFYLLFGTLTWCIA